MASDTRLAARGPRLSTGSVVAIVVAIWITLGLLALVLSGAERQAAVREVRRALEPGPGPARALGGVPVGYAHTADGAVAALLNDSVVLSRLVVASDARHRAALEVLGTPALARGLGDRIARASARAMQTAAGRGLRRGSLTVYRGAPLGYRVLRYRSTEAVIETWAFAVVANDAGLGPQMAFQTARSRMRWARGDWKLAATLSRPGPTPAVAGPITPASLFVPALSGLRDLRYAP